MFKSLEPPEAHECKTTNPPYKPFLSVKMIVVHFVFKLQNTVKKISKRQTILMLQINGL